MAYQPGAEQTVYETQQPQAVVTPQPVGATITAPAETRDAMKLARDVQAEYHDPLDDWSSRDTLLSLLPYIVIIAFKDVALGSALAFGIAWSGFLLLMRYVAWDGRHKTIWAILDLAFLVMCAILRGLWRHFSYELHKWMPLMIPLILVSVALVSLLVRRPFIGHYARYPKFDRGGRAVWKNDAKYRKTCDLITLGWIAAWSVILLLTLAAIIPGDWHFWGVLNIIFCYIVPFVLIAWALVFQQLMGNWYRNAASTTLAVPQGQTRGVELPAGAAQV